MLCKISHFSWKWKQNFFENYFAIKKFAKTMRVVAATISCAKITCANICSKILALEVI